MSDDKPKTGFAAMDPEKHRELCRKAGMASHQKGTSHEWTSETAKEAGRKGGKASRGGRAKALLNRDK